MNLSEDEKHMLYNGLKSSIGNRLESIRRSTYEEDFSKCVYMLDLKIVDDELELLAKLNNEKWG